ncbi:amidase [Caulobacter sp. CCUG 60055]|uniref:amidase n=1 Tax=Caulobacter sp. CCUG 60055 TaxID=2100090 RepID=UPI001FA6C04D|nr:amidase family protein [Caulobacter sp. CCUG 60055]MCI3179586.1 amidase [Caulobacter sp. CCUG 60055]
MPIIGPQDTSGMERAYRAREISPVEAVEAALDAAEATQDTLNAFVFIDREGALRAAAESEMRWRAGSPLSPLDGAPVSVKDNIHVEGLPTSYGSLATTEEKRWGPDSPSVARMREAGMAIIGKTTLPDHAFKVTTESPLTGVTRNPWNPAHTPGGSSGGAAAAVGGFGGLALGTDGGGSIRVPAAWTGVVGFKPSLARVPHHPRGTFGPLSHVGPLARNVRDVARLMSIIAKPDSRDWYASGDRGDDFETPLSAQAQPMRIALSPTLGLGVEVVGSEIRTAVEAAARVFEQLGCDVRLMDPPAVREAVDLHGYMWVSFCALLSQRFGHAASELDVGLRRAAALGASLRPTEVTDLFVRRGDLGSVFWRFFEDYDLVLAPTAPCTAPAIADLDEAQPFRVLTTSWCNLVGLPAISVPCGLARNGLPIGLQIVGGPRADLAVLKAAFAYEHARGPMQSPPSVLAV